MATKYIHQLTVICNPTTALQLSSYAYALCPDVGENNVSTELNANGDDAAATYMLFSAPVTQAHIDALFGAGLGVTPGVRWWRTDRSGVLEKRYDNETPTPVQFTLDDALAECGLKLRKVPVEV